MIREYLGRKAAETIDRTRFSDTRAGKIATTILDDERLENIGQDGLTSIAADMRNSFLRNRMLSLAIAVNAISWIPVFIIPSVVSKMVLVCGFVFSKGSLLLVAPALGFTIFGVYSFLRIWFPDRNYGPGDGVIMQSYGRDTESLLTWKLWLVSCGIAGVDTILLVFAYLAMTGE